MGPVGQAVSAMCSAPGASGEAASSQDVGPFPCVGAGVGARMGSIGRGPPWGQRARGFVVGMGSVRIPGSRLRASAGAVVPSHRVTQPASTAHAVCRPGIRAAMRIDGNRVSARGTGFWKCARQVDVISIRLLASAGQVCSIRVAQGCARRQPGCAVQCHGTLRNRRRARHNTQLCSNRLVTEAGLPAEGTAGCMSALLCRSAGAFRSASNGAGGTRDFCGGSPGWVCASTYPVLVPRRLELRCASRNTDLRL